MEPQGPSYLGALGKCLVCLSLRVALDNCTGVMAENPTKLAYYTK